MGTAVVVALVTSIVAALGVTVNALTALFTVREETKRTREARDAEDRRLREDRDAEARRREAEAVAVAERAERADRDARVQRRWGAVREAIDAEAKVRASDSGVIVYEYMRHMQAMSLLTHPEERPLRSALLRRAKLAERSHEVIEAQLDAEWWHPWASEWARSVDEPLLTASGDTGMVF